MIAPKSPNQSWTDLQAVVKRNNAANSVQVLFVCAGGQIFGLLMSQLFNILKVDGDEPRLTRQTKLNDKDCTVVEHRGQFVPVVSLSKVLLMENHLPVEKSEILLTGKLRGNSTLLQVYGLCVDSVMTVHSFRREDLRHLPDWLYKKRLGNILIGAILVEPNLIVLDTSETEVVPVSEPLSNGLLNNAERVKPDRKAALYNSFVIQSQPKVEQDVRRPVMLINLDTIRSQLYGE